MAPAEGVGTLIDDDGFNRTAISPINVHVMGIECTDIGEGTVKRNYSVRRGCACVGVAGRHTGKYRRDVEDGDGRAIRVHSVIVVGQCDVDHVDIAVRTAQVVVQILVRDVERAAPDVMYLGTS